MRDGQGTICKREEKMRGWGGGAGGYGMDIGEDGPNENEKLSLS